MADYKFKENVWKSMVSNTESSKYIAQLVTNGYYMALGEYCYGRDNKRCYADIFIQLSQSNQRTYPDICMSIVEIDDLNNYLSDKEQELSACSAKMLSCGCKEWLITNGNQYIFISDLSTVIRLYDIESAWQRIVSITANSVEFTVTEIWNKILAEIGRHCENHDVKEIYDLIYNLSFNDNDFSVSNRSFSLKPDKELELMSRILLDHSMIEPVGKLCRYISIGSLKRLLIATEFSMGGMAGMNDSSELHAFKALTNSDLDSDRIIVYPHLIAEENSYFINSFSNYEKYDDLTMWRLYGEDGMGACLTFEYSIRDISSRQNMYLFPVSYFAEIPKIANIAIKLLNNGIKLGNRNFTIGNLNLWQHFIKPIEFSDESEIRLLLHHPQDESNLGCVSWILNSNNHIFHPIFKFKSYTKFPLHLKKITLGPKFPCLDINIGQISYLAKKIDPNIIIDGSKCRFYH